MDIELKNRTSEYVTVFWNKMQDDKIKRFFPIRIGTVEESLVLFENSLKADSKSFGKAIYFGEKYIGDVWPFTYSNNYASICLLQKTGFMEVEEFLEDVIESKYFERRVVEGKFFGEMEELL